jgi:hypothetical protein
MTIPKNKWKQQELIDQVAALETKLNALITAFNAHTHNGDGAQAGAYYTSPPRTNAATVTAGTASTVTALDLSAV